MQINSPNPFWNHIFQEQTGRMIDPDPVRNRLQSLLPYARIAGFNDDECLWIRETVQRYCGNETILTVLEIMYQALFRTHKTEAAQDPEIQDITGDDKAFNLIVLLSYAPELENDYKQNNWSNEMFRQALRDFKIWSDHCVENFGKPGLSYQGGYGWIHAQMLCQILRFGRLQCNIRAHFFQENIVFRHKNSRKVQVIMNGRMDFNPDGLFRVADEPLAFSSAPAVRTENTITGLPVSPDGIVSPEPVCLNLSEWEEVLSPGDPIINLHIPADGPLLPELCADSVRRMWDFFHQQTDFKVKAVCCESWLLDPQFPKILPPESNMLKFQMAGYLMPEYGESDCFGRVFGLKSRTEGIQSVPWNTSMRKAFGKFSTEGGHFRNGRIVLLPEDFPWGSNPYRKVLEN